jgi:hypothetical protein
MSEMKLKKYRNWTATRLISLSSSLSFSSSLFFSKIQANLNMNFYFLLQKFKPLPSSSISSCFDSFLPLLELKQVLGKDINLKLHSKNYHTFEVTIFLPIP